MARAALKDKLTLWREDAGAFARDLLGLELWPHQIEVLNASKPFRVVVKARQTGGSVALAVAAIHAAFTRPGSTTPLISATEDAAKRLAATVRDLLADSDLLRSSVTEESKTRIVLTNGSQIVSLPASQRQIRGYTADGALILDEAAFMSEELWRAALYTVAAVRQPLVYLVSTPWGSADHFFRRLWHEGQDPRNPDYVSFHWDYRVSPKINHALLEREKERTDPLTYRAEVLGEWVDDADSYFTFDEVMNAVADYPLLPPEQAAGEVVFGGVDYGVRYDSNALVLVAPLAPWVRRDGSGSTCFIVPWLEEHPAGRTDLAGFTERVAATSCAVRQGRPRPGYHYQLLVTETNGVGAMPSQELAKRMGAVVVQEPLLAGTGWEAVLPVATTATYKRDAYGRLKMLLQQGRLVLPRHPKLMKQLTSLRYEISAAGTISIAASSPAIHDDLCDALAHAVEATRPLDRWLPGWLSFGRARADAQWVETQAGLRIPVTIRDALPVAGWSR